MKTEFDHFPDETWLPTMEKYWKSNPSFLLDIENAGDREELKQALTAEGFSRFSFHEDAEGVSLERVAAEHDVIVLDTGRGASSVMGKLTALAADPVTRTLPILVLSEDGEGDVRAQALRFGEPEFLRRPIDNTEARIRVRNTLRIKAFQDFLADENKLLDDIVHVRTHALLRSRLEVIQRLAKAAEYRDNETGRHVLRVGQYAALMSRGLGFTEDQVELMVVTSPLHDIGKIGIRDGILLKAGKLTPEEWDTMKRHTLIGFEMLRERAAAPEDAHTTVTYGNAHDLNDNPLIHIASMIALTHHEKMDGSGYPFGLRSDEIPMEGRIVAVADVYDALQSERPYKKAFPVETCVKIIRESAGPHLDPRVVEVFLDHLDDVRYIQDRYAEPAGTHVES